MRRLALTPAEVRWLWEQTYAAKYPESLALSDAAAALLLTLGLEGVQRLLDTQPSRLPP